MKNVFLLTLFFPTLFASTFAFSQELFSGSLDKSKSAFTQPEKTFWYPGSWYQKGNESAGAQWDAHERSSVIYKDGRAVYSYMMGVSAHVAAVEWWFIARDSKGNDLCKILLPRIHLGATGSNRMPVIYKITAYEHTKCLADHFDRITQVVTDPAYSEIKKDGQSWIDWYIEHKEEIDEAILVIKSLASSGG